MKAAPLNNQGPIRWQPDRGVSLVSWPVPTLARAVGRGLRMRCPACGVTRLFTGYLSVAPICANCAAPLGLARADDAPPYFTIFIVGHLIVGSMLLVERAWQPPLWLDAAIWVPLTLVLTLLLLRPIKGATVGLMLTLGMLKSGSDE